MFKFNQFRSPPGVWLLAAYATTLTSTPTFAQHKTGMSIDFRLQHEINENDTSVEGDRRETEFILKKARWFLSGKTDYYGYKVEWDSHKGPVTLRSLRFDYFLSKATTLSMGKGFKPIPMSGPHRYFKGDVGIQLATTFDGGSFKLGLAHRKPGKWANGIGGQTTLKTQAIGMELKGKFDNFEPFLRLATNRIPAEKVLATGYKYHGRTSEAITVGGTYKSGATKLVVEAGTVERSKVKESLNGGPQYEISPKVRLVGYKATLTQGFTSQWSGKLSHKEVTDRENNEKKQEFSETAVEAIYAPHKDIPMTYYGKIAHKIKKKKDDKRRSETEFSLGAKASPSVVIAEK